MKDFGVDFSAGLSSGEVKAVAGRLNCAPDGIGAFVEELLSATDRRVAMNLAWVLTHLGRNEKLRFLTPYRDRLIDFAMSELPIRRGLVLSLLLDLPDADEPRVDFLNYCLEHIADAGETNGTRTCMIYLAGRMCSCAPELQAELREVLGLLQPPLPPSIACAVRRVAGCTGKVRPLR